jgi:hypothetical protein
MPTNLARLDVSLTKHGAHKVAQLLKKYDKDEVLEHVSGSEPGVNIARSQAVKTLAARAGIVPDVWTKARQRGSETINALVLVAIIYSHHGLIRAMQESTNKRPFCGRIERGKNVDGKAFTNFANNIEELGFSTEHSPDHVDFDLHRLFEIHGFNELLLELLTTVLRHAGWEATNSVIDECIALKFHEVFSVGEQEFRDWLSSGSAPGAGDKLSSKDADYFLKGTDRPSTGEFTFKAGHAPKKTGTVVVSASRANATADLLHNEMQNALIAELCGKFGSDNVGSEQSTGSGTSIDVVVKAGKETWFYEIKTDASVKACIRQAIPQLLEYAYWQGKAAIADRLIIVGPSPISKEAETYLGFLRSHFGLPFSYEQHKVPERPRRLDLSR